MLKHFNPEYQIDTKDDGQMCLKIIGKYYSLQINFSQVLMAIENIKRLKGYELEKQKLTSNLFLEI
jgi:hypothetical protein